MKQEHKYAQVLRWIADGEVVQHFRLGQWRDRGTEFLLAIISGDVHEDLVNFRIKPRTVVCNGVEVPAPESVAPMMGTAYYIPETRDADQPCQYKWKGDATDKKWLAAGLVYLDKEACIARAKAMLLTKPC